jgi:hypothetical protein
MSYDRCLTYENIRTYLKKEQQLKHNKIYAWGRVQGTYHLQEKELQALKDLANFEKIREEKLKVKEYELHKQVCYVLSAYVLLIS